jgi:tetratricopeptide (TPR) repeat protein
MSGRKSSFPGRKNSAFSKKGSLRPSVFQQPVLKEGYLEKLSSGTVKKWQSRYFEISGHYLNYYEKKEARSEQAVKGAFDLKHIREVSAAATSITIEVNDGSTVDLRGASEEVARLWVVEIKQVVESLSATAAHSESALAPGTHAEARDNTNPACPHGIDPEVFALLPDELKREVANTHRQQEANEGGSTVEEGGGAEESESEEEGGGAEDVGGGTEESRAAVGRGEGKEQWPCPQCTFVNGSSNRMCEMCGMNSPVADEGKLACPPGIDPEVFAQLPEGMQQEAVHAHQQEQYSVDIHNALQSTPHAPAPAPAQRIAPLLLAVVVEGFPQPEQALFGNYVPELNGRYSAVQDTDGKNKMVNGRHVWKKDGENCYLYYAQRTIENDERWHWWISNEEDTEAGKPMGYAKVASEAVDPQDINGTWEKQSADGSWSDADGSHIWSTEFQFAGNHFTRGITLQGFVMLLSIIGWDQYNIAERKKHKGLSWLQDPEKNGYDLCKVVIPAYMVKIGLEHLSLTEAIESGQVAELVCLKDMVGAADAFVSHVQKLPVRVLLASLKDGESKYADELLEDTAAVAALRKTALEEFLQEKGQGHNTDRVIAHLGFEAPWTGIEFLCQNYFGSAPALTSITARKPGPPKYFIDYAGIRQCLSNEFTIDRCVDAIATIGTTVVELDADFYSETALLRRIFCVLESFATIEARGKLLVCGPAVQEAEQTLQLAALAADPETCKGIIDSETKAKCRWAEEEAKIKAYMEGSVGFARTDRVVLAAIVASCLRSAEAVFGALPDRGMAILHAVGCMLEEVGDYHTAQVQLEAALGKGEAAFGEGAFETTETVYMLGKCHRRTDGESMAWFERSLRMSEAQYGKEHAATARSLVGIGERHVTDGNHDKDEAKIAKGLECLHLAIARIEAADCPSDHADAHADALEWIGDMHSHKQEWRECLEWSERSVRMRESKHGPDHALAVESMVNMASAHQNLGDPEKGMALQLRVLGIIEKARGRLSREAGLACFNIGAGHYNKREYSEAAGWFKRAVEAYEYTSGPARPHTVQWRGGLKRAIDRMDPADAKTQEYRRFLEESEERART